MPVRGEIGNKFYFNKGERILSELDKKSMTYLRVMATLFIICCHIVYIFDSKLIQLSAQLLNVGVYLFLIISGYLYGKKDITKNGSYRQWIISRAKRILIPMYIFMIFLFFIYLILDKNIKALNWIIYVFNLQGLEMYVHGAEHLWYLTIAMICYFVTIILDKYKFKLTLKKLSIFFGVYILIQLIISYFIYQQLGRYMILIGLYIVSYIIGYYWNSNTINNRLLIYSAIGVFVSICIRIVGMLKLDGSTSYNVLIVGYTHSVLGLGIFFIGIYIVKLLNKDLEFKFVSHIDSISYEIYLVHYMFIGGPISLMTITNNKILNCIFVLICTYLSALVLRSICNVLYKIIDCNISKMSSQSI